MYDKDFAELVKIAAEKLKEDTVYKMLTRSEDYQKESDERDKAEQKLETLKELPWCRFHKEYLFVEPGDKSVGIKMMVDHFKGNYKDVVVFGDEKNDLSMFRDEWTSIAMGNAIDELKEKATYVTTPCDQDGIYNACVHFDWIKEKD